MRVAVISDIHDNLTALEAVAKDLRRTSPDLVLHAGDVVGMGSAPADVLDFVIAKGWEGIQGNNEEMLLDPASFEEFISTRNPQSALWGAIRTKADWAREQLGEYHLGLIRHWPRSLWVNGYSIVHASATSTWVCPNSNALDEDWHQFHEEIGANLVVFGHLHIPFVHAFAGFTIANSGSVGASLDGDPRASYLLIQDGSPEVVRVPYPIETEVQRIRDSGLPHSDWTIHMLRSASFQPLA